MKRVIRTRFRTAVILPTSHTLGDYDGAKIQADLLSLSPLFILLHISSHTGHADFRIFRPWKNQHRFKEYHTLDICLTAFCGICRSLSSGFRIPQMLDLRVGQGHGCTLKRWPEAVAMQGRPGPQH